MSYQIINCTSAMADVISGSIPQPRDRRPDESLWDWLRQTPAWPHIEREFHPHSALAYTPPADTAADLPIGIALSTASDIVPIAINIDGTRFGKPADAPH